MILETVSCNDVYRNICFLAGRYTFVWEECSLETYESDIFSMNILPDNMRFT
jgi:hypothetical protein